MVIAKTVEAGLNIRKVVNGYVTWLDVVEPGLAEMDYLRRTYNFHQLALEDCLSQVQLPKLDNYDDYLFLVLHFPRFRLETRLTRPVQVSFFVSGDYIVTVHSGELQPLFKLFSDCENDEKYRSAVFGHNSGYLLYRILNELVAYMFPILSKVIQQVDELEEGIFEGGSAETLTRKLSVTRRDILSYRRIVRPQIAVMELLESTEFPFLRVDPDVYFGDLADSMRRIRVELDDLRDMIEGLSDTHLSLTSQQTNQVMRLLTIISTIMLPLSVVSGLYGMNVSLPIQESISAFWVVLGIMVLIAAGMLTFFRFRRWF
jgi:magnesium transporter